MKSPTTEELAEALRQVILCYKDVVIALNVEREFDGRRQLDEDMEVTDARIVYARYCATN